MAVVRKKQDDKYLLALRELVTTGGGGNRQCFDCGQKGPTYVNMTIGSFVCTRCSGVLRGITPPHRVKSISMATFTQEEIDFLKSHGNELCAKTWLGLWDPKRAIHQDHRELMIDKYERKRYYLEPASPLKSLTNAVNLKTAAATTAAKQSSITSTSSTHTATTLNGNTSSANGYASIHLTPPISTRTTANGLHKSSAASTTTSTSAISRPQRNDHHQQQQQQQQQQHNGYHPGLNGLTSLNSAGSTSTGALSDTSSCTSNGFGPDADFVADFGSANIFDATSASSVGSPAVSSASSVASSNGYAKIQPIKAAHRSNKNGIIVNGNGHANTNNSGTNGTENFADFDHAPIYNAAANYEFISKFNVKKPTTSRVKKVTIIESNGFYEQINGLKSNANMNNSDFGINNKNNNNNNNSNNNSNNNYSNNLKYSESTRNFNDPFEDFNGIGSFNRSNNNQSDCFNFNNNNNNNNNNQLAAFESAYNHRNEQRQQVQQQRQQQQQQQQQHQEQQQKQKFTPLALAAHATALAVLGNDCNFNQKYNINNNSNTAYNNNKNKNIINSNNNYYHYLTNKKQQHPFENDQWHIWSLDTSKNSTSAKAIDSPATQDLSSPLETIWWQKDTNPAISDTNNIGTEKTLALEQEDELHPYKYLCNTLSATSLSSIAAASSSTGSNSSSSYGGLATKTNEQQTTSPWFTATSTSSIYAVPIPTETTTSTTSTLARSMSQQSIQQQQQQHQSQECCSTSVNGVLHCFSPSNPFLPHILHEANHLNNNQSDFDGNIFNNSISTRTFWPDHTSSCISSSVSSTSFNSALKEISANVKQLPWHNTSAHDKSNDIPDADVALPAVGLFANNLNTSLFVLSSDFSHLDNMNLNKEANLNVIEQQQLNSNSNFDNFVLQSLPIPNGIKHRNGTAALASSANGNNNQNNNNSPPTEDRYAALKDLDEQLRESKAMTEVAASIVASNVVDSFGNGNNNNPNPFKSQQQQPLQNGITPLINPFQAQNLYGQMTIIPNGYGTSPQQQNQHAVQQQPQAFFNYSNGYTVSPNATTVPGSGIFPQMMSATGVPNGCGFGGFAGMQQQQPIAVPGVGAGGINGHGAFNNPFAASGAVNSNNPFL